MKRDQLYLSIYLSIYLYLSLSLSIYLYIEILFVAVLIYSTGALKASQNRVRAAPEAPGHASEAPEAPWNDIRSIDEAGEAPLSAPSVLLRAKSGRSSILSSKCGGPELIGIHGTHLKSCRNVIYFAMHLISTTIYINIYTYIYIHCNYLYIMHYHFF